MARVVVVNLPLQQIDAVSRTLQTLVRAHDAHVVPHETPQLGPIVRQHHLLVRIRHPAFVPCRRRWRGPAAGGRVGAGGDVRGGGFREHQAFK